MQEPIDTSKVPDSINTRMDSADKAVAALLMKFHAIKDGSTLVRFCLRAALREASAIPGSSLAMTLETHHPLESR
jgi:hypothetical protein